MPDVIRCENFIIRVPDQELYVLPVYREDDPNVLELLSYLDSAEDRARLCAPHMLGQFETFDTGEEKVLAVYLEDTDQEMVLATVLTDILFYIEDSGCLDVAIGQLGLIEYGFVNESKWANFQAKKMGEYMTKHEGVTLTLVAPIADSRPLHGQHLGDGIIPEIKPGVDDEADLPIDAEHHLVAVPLNKVGSYADYLRAYIDGREQETFIIRPNPGETFDDNGIHDLKDLQRNLAFYEGRGGHLENFSKWDNPVKSKNGKAYYFPVPSKQKLKFIIAMLDMSYAEALECLHFFGYSLAHYDREDLAFTYMLKNGKNWPKPLDIVKVNETLKKRYGKKAALYVDHRKGARK